MNNYVAQNIGKVRMCRKGNLLILFVPFFICIPCTEKRPKLLIGYLFPWWNNRLLFSLVDQVAIAAICIGVDGTNECDTRLLSQAVRLSSMGNLRQYHSSSTTKGGYPGLPFGRSKVNEAQPEIEVKCRPKKG